MTAIESAIEIAGNQVKLAKICGVAQQTVSSWKRKGYVEEESILAVFRAANKSIPIALFHDELNRYQKPRAETLSEINRSIKYSIKRLGVLQKKGKNIVYWLNSLAKAHPEQEQLYCDLVAHEEAAIKLRDNHIKELTTVIQLT